MLLLCLLVVHLSSTNLRHYQNLNLLTRYKRNQLFGGSLTKAFNNTVLRSEYGYSTNKYFLSRDANGIVGFSETPEFKVAVALDYNADDELLVFGGEDRVLERRSISDGRLLGLVRDLSFEETEGAASLSNGLLAVTNFRGHTLSLIDLNTGSTSVVVAAP